MFINRASKEVETQLLKAAFQQITEEGWHHFKLNDAAKAAHLSSEFMRNHFPFKFSLLLALNRRADENALNHPDNGATLRDKIFESFMQRFDIFQDYREGLRSILQALPRDPALAAILSAATMDSMRWIADNAHLDRNGITGFARLNNLFLIWLHTLHIWEKDTTPDLSETMNGLNIALDRAERLGFLKETIPSERNISEPPLSETLSESIAESISEMTEDQASLPDSLPDFKADEKS